MKICYIISDINKAVYFEQTALHLREKQLDVSFILINSTNGALHQFLKEHQFTVHTLESGSLLKSRPAMKACKKLLRELAITHVHCHLAHANWIGLWAAKNAKIPVRIYTRHSGAPLKLHWKEKLIDKVQNRLATNIVSISQNIDYLLKNQGVPAKKRVLIHHGFDLERFSRYNEAEVQRIRETYNSAEQFPVIGVIARWMEWKGIQYTIEAFRELLKTHPDGLLCLFGASDHADYSAEIRELVASLPEKNVRVVSFENNVFDLYHLFDVYVHVPVNPACEAFGQTYVEALAAGIPSVFTLSGIAREFIVHEQNALTVPFQDAAAIHQAVMRLLEETMLREKIASNGTQRVSELFSFEGYIQNLQKLYSA